MIEKLLYFLKSHPPQNVAIAILFYLLVVLPHEQVGKVIAWIFDGHMTRHDYNLTIAAASVAGLLGYGYLLVKKTRQDSALRDHIALYLLATVVLSVACFKLLIIINIEVVHFVQYAAVAILVFPLVRRYGETVLWCTLLGALDEAWQYFYLAPHRTNYYDFNDVIINLLGSVYGLLLVRAASPAFAAPVRAQFWKSPPLYAALGLIGLVLVAMQLGLMCLYAPAYGRMRLWSLIREPQEGFWTTVHPQVTFHVVQPIEGLVVLGLLLWFYAGLGRPVSTAQT